MSKAAEGAKMTGHKATDWVASGNKVWITVDKNRYRRGETIIAALNTEGLFTERKVKAILTDPRGNTEMTVPAENESGGYCLPVEADLEGAYTLVCIIEEIYEAASRLGTASNVSKSGGKDIKRLYICSTSFFVGDCEAAIPKVPEARLLFVPEIWEDPHFYKLISVYLKMDGKPLPFAPVTLTLQNRNGYLQKALSADDSGNVCFSPYMGGTYCLTGKAAFDDTGEDGGSVDVTATFSFKLPESEGKRQRKTNRHIAVSEFQIKKSWPPLGESHTGVRKNPKNDETLQEEKAL